MSYDPFQILDVSAYHPPTNFNVEYAHREIGHFSINEDRYFFPDKSQLATLRLPPDTEQLDLDLNVGFEEWKELPNVQQHLDTMLHWILLNKQLMTEEGDFQQNTNGSSLNVDFVTSRGNLTRVLNVLNGSDGKRWTLVAQRYRGTIYLSHIEEEKSQAPSTNAQRICYWGKRFEVEVTKNGNPRPSSGSAASRQGPIKAYPGFFSVVRLQLGDHVIVLRAEVDAQIEEEFQEPPSNYVELKVVTETIARASWAFRRKKLIPWWCQSIISGAPLIVYGIRDYCGHVKSIKQIRTDEIPGCVQREAFHQQTYLHFLNDVLCWIKSIASKDDPTAVYMFSWDPYARDKFVTVRLLPPDPENSFLRNWYVNQMEEFFLVKELNQETVERARQLREEEANRNDVERSAEFHASSFPSEDIYDARHYRNERWNSSANERIFSPGTCSGSRADKKQRRSPQAADARCHGYPDPKRARHKSTEYSHHGTVDTMRQERRNTERNRRGHVPQVDWRSTRNGARSRPPRFNERNASKSFHREADPTYSTRGQRTRRHDEAQHHPHSSSRRYAYHRGRRYVR